MSGSKSRKVAPFPTREQIATFIRDGGPRVGKREIARAFRLDAEQKIELRRVLKEMEGDGTLARDRGRRFREPGTLPSVGVIEITGVDTDGETTARPFGWTDGAPPLIYVAPEKRSRAAYAAGEKVLARLQPVRAVHMRRASSAGWPPRPTACWAWSPPSATRLASCRSTSAPASSFYWRRRRRWGRRRASWCGRRCSRAGRSG